MTQSWEGGVQNREREKQREAQRPVNTQTEGHRRTQP